MGRWRIFYPASRLLLPALMASLADTLGPISARLGEPEGDPVALEGGITNRNYRVRFAGEDIVVRLPGKDTELLEIATLAEVTAALRALLGREELLPVEFSSFRIVEIYAARMAERGAEVPSSYEWALAAAHRIEAALIGPEHDPVPCHNDLL